MIVIIFLDIPRGRKLWYKWWFIVNRMCVNWVAVDVKEASSGGDSSKVTVSAWRDIIAVRTHAITCK